MKKRTLPWAILAVLTLGAILFHAAPPPPMPPATNLLAVDTLAANPSVMVVNTPTTVTISVPITDPSYVAGSANVVRLAPSGAPSTLIGQLYDDGTHGDDTAGDHIFTAQLSFNEAATGQVQLQVSAGFKGSLKRIFSLPLSIPVWQRYAHAGAPVSFGYPPFPGVPYSIDLLNGGSVVAFDIPTGTGTLTTLSAFTISTGTSRVISVSEWFAQNVDSSNLLLDNGTYSLITLPNGTEALILTGALPNEWSGGPLSQAYVMSPDRTNLAVVQISIGSPLFNSSTNLNGIVNLISQTITFQ